MFSENQFKRTVFEDMKASMQTINFKLSIKELNLSEIQNISDDEITVNKEQRFKNQKGMYINIGYKLLFCRISTNDFGVVGCKSIFEGIEAVKIFIDHIAKRKIKIDDLYKGVVTVKKVEEVLTNFHFSIGHNLDLEVVHNHFKEYEDFFSSYVPSVQMNLTIKHPIGTFNGKKKDVTFTITRKGKVRMSGRSIRSIEPIYNKFYDIFEEVIPYAIL